MIGIDGDETEAPALEIVAEGLQASFDPVGGGAVVRGEQHHQHVGAGEVGEFIGAAIDAGQGKIRRGVADRERA